MQDSIIIAVDPGNVNLKFSSSVNEEPSHIPNLIAEKVIPKKVKDQDYINRGVTSKGDLAKVYEDIMMTIIHNNQELGSFAIGTKAGVKAARGPGESKSNSNRIKNSVLAAMALSAINYEKPKDESYNVLFGTVLPINELKDENVHQAKEYIASFKGKYEFIIYTNFFKVRITLHLQESGFLGAEGVMSYLNVVTDSEGRLQDVFKEIHANKYILINDCGGGTFDLAIIKNNKPQKDLSDNLEEGITTPQSEIIGKLKEDGIKPPSTTMSLDQVIREAGGQWYVGRETIDLKPYIRASYNNFTDRIIGFTRSFISNIEDEEIKNNLVHFTTGGAMTQFGGRFKEAFSHDTEVIESNDPLYDNLLGTYKQLKIMQEEKLQKIQKKSS